MTETDVVLAGFDHIWYYRYPTKDIPFVSNKEVTSHLFQMIGSPPIRPLLEIDDLQAAELYRAWTRDTMMVRMRGN